MCPLSPVGRQWGASCLRAEQPLVPGRCHQLGHRLWPEKQTWCVHQSDRSSSLDLQQDGGKIPAPGHCTQQTGNFLKWGPWRSTQGVGRDPLSSLVFGVFWTGSNVMPGVNPSCLCFFPCVSSLRTELRELQKGGPRGWAGSC